MSRGGGVSPAAGPPGFASRRCNAPVSVRGLFNLEPAPMPSREWPGPCRIRRPPKALGPQFTKTLETEVCAEGRELDVWFC